jgi:chromosome partitioning protein
MGQNGVIMGSFLPPVVICGGIKGGVGKSILAINLAVLSAQQGYKVLLVDADEQHTVSDWSDIRSEAVSSKLANGPTVIRLSDRAVKTEVQKMLPDRGGSANSDGGMSGFRA